ncbi:MAG: TetR/AcrR family transcriptional regulator [Bacteroidetes bacterium]|nr:TetR/AcrR family transcriptional regulator [Bacteroidota bacterium]MBU1718848.1 TetR/AcrR family transcriptional regulator [Bacteroidota bacterium]
MVKSKETESHIHDAARSVFLAKGYDGARMQEIADEAGINKALLHYYFRSKDKLFESIFQEAFSKIVPQLFTLLTGSFTLREKLGGFIENYIRVIAENPFVPGFILHEMNRNPDRIVSMLSASGIQPAMILGALSQELEKNNVYVPDPRHLIVNLLALCLFPFAGRPIIQGFLFGGDKEAYEVFLSERAEIIKEFVFKSLGI